jgi:hypothetical protein
METVNNCIVIPDRANWREGVKWRRRWATEIAPGVTAAEDRSTGRAAPLHSLDYQITTFTPEQRARLNQRLLAALRSGRAVVPHWARAQYVTAWAALETTPSGGGSHTVSGIEAGRWYYYEAGPQDQYLGLTFEGIVHRGNTWFRPALDTGILIVSTGTPGRIYPADQVLTTCTCDGLWPWAVGDTAFFVRPTPKDQEATHERVAHLINCGGSASGTWSADALGTGGTTASTVTAQNTSLVTVDPAPSAVYQTARNLSTSTTSDAIVYTITGLARGIPCRLRLHFSEIAAGFNGTTARRRMDITFTGIDTQTIRGFEPAETAGALNKAVTLCAIVTPSLAGTVQITCKPSYVSVKVVATSHVDLGYIIYSIDGVNLTSGDRVLFTGQTLAQDNGIRTVNIVDPSLDHPRATDCTHPYDIVGQVIQIEEGSAAGLFYRNINGNPLVVDTDEIDYELVVGDALHAGINGIELYQYTWETLTLTGVGEGTLEWSGWLKGVYGDTPQFHPAFFGTPSVGEASALTAKHADLRLRISEPLGSGTVATPGTCAADACYDDGPLASVPTPLWGGGMISCEDGWMDAGVQWGLDYTIGSYTWELGLDDYGYAHPADGIPVAVLQWWAQTVWQAWKQYKRDNDLTTRGDRLVWNFDSNASVSSTKRWPAQHVYSGTAIATVSLNYTIRVEYCVPVP